MRVHLFCIVAALPGVAAAVDFERDVAPLLIRRCLECHKGKEPSGSLSLESAASLRAGGDSGPVTNGDDPADSLLLHRVHDDEMPPPLKGVSQALSADERAILDEWIGKGATWPAGRTLDLYEVTTPMRGGRDWWAFQPISRPAVPNPREGSGVTNPVDAFIVARLERSGLSLAACGRSAYARSPNVL